MLIRCSSAMCVSPCLLRTSSRAAAVSNSPRSARSASSSASESGSPSCSICRKISMCCGPSSVAADEPGGRGATCSGREPSRSTYESLSRLRNCLNEVMVSIAPCDWGALNCGARTAPRRVRRAFPTSAINAPIAPRARRVLPRWVRLRWPCELAPRKRNETGAGSPNMREQDVSPGSVPAKACVWEGNTTSPAAGARARNHPPGCRRFHLGVSFHYH